MSNLIVNLRLPQLRMRPVTGAALFRYERMVCGKWVSCNHSRATAIVGVFSMFLLAQQPAANLLA